MNLFGLSRRALLSATLGAVLAVFVVSACRRAPRDLPKLGHLSGFTLTDQGGRTVSANDLRGKAWVAAFFFTRCPTICPRITRRMRALQIEAAQRKLALSLVSFSVDPDNDTPQVLSAYAGRYGADLATWRFLTGDYARVEEIAVNGFKLALEGKPDAGADHMGIIHGSHLVLVDPALEIRGYYRSDDESELGRLLDDAGSLAGNAL